MGKSGNKNRRGEANRRRVRQWNVRVGGVEGGEGDRAEEAPEGKKKNRS